VRVPESAATDKVIVLANANANAIAIANASAIAIAIAMLQDGIEAVLDAKNGIEGYAGIRAGSVVQVRLQ